LVYSRATGQYTGTLTIKNTSASTIPGPIQLALTNLSAGAVLVNATGTAPDGPYTGSPYITTAAASLAPGASVTVTVKFTISGSTPISYVAKTLSGGF
jgi:hypothetical protein